MLGKLIKYEFKATARTLIPLYIALLIFALINKIFMNSNISSIVNDVLRGIPSIISIFAYIATMVAVFIVTFFIIIQRFYKNILVDEGYLMNTLPVATWKTIGCKFVVAIIWSIVSFIVAILSLLILSFGSDIINLNSIYDILCSKYGFKVSLIFLEFFVAFLFQMSSGILMMYSSISIGHLFNKRKILASLGAFLAFNIIVNTIILIIIMCFSNVFSNFINLYNSPFSQGNLILISCIVINLLLCIGYFSITNYIVKNKLNLE